MAVATCVSCHINQQTQLLTLVPQVDQTILSQLRLGVALEQSGPFTSTLSATADPVLDYTLVECFGPAATLDPGNRVGNSTIQIVGQ